MFYGRIEHLDKMHCESGISVLIILTNTQILHIIFKIYVFPLIVCLNFIEHYLIASNISLLIKFMLTGMVCMKHNHHQLKTYI